ncbi:hypothetical protein DFH07DRAFT_536542 [Mycena maculata]|uniref:Uncharacterized protein n=1 Tax=Mycena maculata TaxID=230809 RepID=A0AAD7K580_9AGAR|nr:hypothetical protein DFH07DRAFT_536542 [Mycena maculata]
MDLELSTQRQSCLHAERTHRGLSADCVWVGIYLNDIELRPSSHPILPPSSSHTRSTTSTMISHTPDFKSPVLNTVLGILSNVTTELSDADTVSRTGKVAAADYDSMSVLDKNKCVLGMVLDSYASEGYFAGWQCLANVASRVPLPTQLVADVFKCVGIYQSIRPAKEERKPTDLHITISLPVPGFDSLYHVTPKSIGGKAWMHSDEYTPEAQRAWCNTDFAPMSPCAAFIWLAVQRKTISKEDLDACNALTLLGTVDYDLDRVEAHKPGFRQALNIAMRHVGEVGTQMQGTALAALLNFDVQKYGRQVQEQWVAGGKGAANSGPHAISAEDWVATIVGDCGGLAAFAYEGAAVYPESRSTMFPALLLANTHDLLFDMATSNLMSSAMYAAGVSDYNVAPIFAMSTADVVARRICALPDSSPPLYGDNSLLGISAWAPFNERYRTWERFVKYSRQIGRSTSTTAQHVAEMARIPLVFKACNILDLATAWRSATGDVSKDDFAPRQAVAYKPASAPEILDIPGVPEPDLCRSCTELFRNSVNDFATDKILAIDSLPMAVVSCRAVARAAAIRRAAIFASGDHCCDACACRIGCWADVAGYTVLTALMASDQTASASEWVLQCYAAWAVTTSPVSVATVLTGFDLICDLKEQDGAMGARDVLDC